MEGLETKNGRIGAENSFRFANPPRPIGDPCIGNRSSAIPGPFWFIWSTFDLSVFLSPWSSFGPFRANFRVVLGTMLIVSRFIAYHNIQAYFVRSRVSAVGHFGERLVPSRFSRLFSRVVTLRGVPPSDLREWKSHD